MKKKIVLLDCTLRDGGYYNNWDFPKNLISKYLKSMAASGVEFAEIGFRSLETKTFKGACAYSRDSFIKNLQIPSNLKIGVMINASELLNYKSTKQFDKNFVQWTINHGKKSSDGSACKKCVIFEPYYVLAYICLSLENSNDHCCSNVEKSENYVNYWYKVYVINVEFMGKFDIS